MISVHLLSCRAMAAAISLLNRLLKNVIEAAETRKKQAKKRSLVN